MIHPGAPDDRAGAPTVPVAGAPGWRAAVLVEGGSDRRAVEALALRRGRDLAAEGIRVVPMGGATNIGRFLRRLGPAGLDLRIAGLCDAAEARHYARSLERAGLGGGLTGAGMERLGFFVCHDDLEDELIRAVGTAAMEELIDAQEELGSFRTFRRQPAQREKTVEQQMRRFIGTRSGRKLRYAAALVEAVDLARMPRPLDGVLGAV